MRRRQRNGGKARRARHSDRWTRCGPGLGTRDDVDPARRRATGTLRAAPSIATFMSSVRLLVGTRKGAFVLTSDGKRTEWKIAGPHFGGWEIYHMKGSPANPNRIYVSQSSGWFGQQIQRSNDGGKTWVPVGN